MNIRVNKEKLDALMKERGHNSYYDLEEVAKQRGIELSYRTIYNVAGNNNWTRNSLVNLCQVLNCEAADFVEFTNGDNGSPHLSPQSVKGKKKQVRVPA